MRLPLVSVREIPCELPCRRPSVRARRPFSAQSFSLPLAPCLVRGWFIPVGPGGCGARGIQAVAQSLVWQKNVRPWGGVVPQEAVAMHISPMPNVAVRM